MRKPGSVVDGHLSGTHVAARLKPPVGTVGQTMVPVGVAADRVYRPPVSPRGAVSSYLAFPPLPRRAKLHITRFAKMAKLVHFAVSPLPTKTGVFVGAPI